MADHRIVRFIGDVADRNGLYRSAIRVLGSPISWDRNVMLISLLIFHLHFCSALHLIMLTSHRDDHIAEISYSFPILCHLVPPPPR